MWLVGEYQHEHRQFSELVQPQILIKSMKHAENQLENDTNEVFSFTVAALVVAPLNCCKLQEADMRCQTESGNADHRTTLATANTQPVHSPASFRRCAGGLGTISIASLALLLSGVVAQQSGDQLNGKSELDPIA